MKRPPFSEFPEEYYQQLRVQFPASLADELWRQYHRQVLAYFIKRGLSQEETLDLTQETFFRFYKAVDLSPDKGPPRAYLFGIAQNLFRNHLRGRRALRNRERQDPWEALFDNLTTEDDGSERPAPLTGILHREELGKLRRSLEELPGQIRLCVELRLYGSRRYWDIADILNISTETVKAYLHEARYILQARLQNSLEDLTTSPEHEDLLRSPKRAQSISQTEPQDSRVSENSSPTELSLLHRAQRELPEDLLKRYAELVERRQAQVLSEPEHAELIQLTERREQDWVERLQAAAQLAQIRQIPLETIVRELRSRQRRHG